MKKKTLGYLACVLSLLPMTALADDSRSTPPAWNWESRLFSSPFNVDTTNCNNIRVPVAGEEVSGSSAGEQCPVDRVAHGFYFGKKRDYIATTPKYQNHVLVCVNPRTFSGVVTNPDTGQAYPRYKNVNVEPCARGGGQKAKYIYEYSEFDGWNYHVEYTVDPNQIYLRCCVAAGA